MKQLFTLSYILLTCAAAMGQCSSSIPANAIVISSSTAANHTQSGANFWICNSAFQQVFSGSNNNFWVEPNGFFNGPTGNNNTIRYKGTVAMGIFGNNNIVYATSTSAISDQGTGTTINVCGANGVVFNYSSAPAAPGCAPVGVEESALAEISVRYDQALDVLVVQDPAGRVQEIRLFDGAGRQMAQPVAAQRTAHSLAGLHAGAYIVQLITAEGNRVHRFVK